MLEIKEKHIPEVFYNNVRKLGSRPFLGWKEKGEWKTMTWNEAEKKVKNLAKGLLKLGVKPKDHVAIFSPNRPEWGISDLAILSCACADIPIYPTNSAEEAEYILNDSGSIIIIVAGKEHLDKVLEARKNTPALKYIITMDKIEGVKDETILHIEEVMAMGEESDKEEELKLRLDSIEIEDMATLIYTSGTTGPPKGVILTHKNFLSNIYQAYLSHKETLQPGQTSLSFLPLSHSLERSAGWNLMVFMGGTIYYAEGPTTVIDDMKEIRPNFLISVPRLFEKIHAGILDKVSKAPSHRRALFNWSAKIGAEATNYITQNKPMPPVLNFQYKIAKKLVLNKLSMALGANNIKVLVSGGGPLSREICEFFHSVGMTVHEGYGLTETSPITNVNTFKEFRFGTVGKSVAETQIKIAEDGEILIKGPQVMKGYYNKPEATAETFTEDGWFKTGDIGVLEDGFLKITDRKKELIITSGGKNISPANIENTIISDKYIENIVAIGDRKQFISALIAPDFIALEDWAKEKGISYGDKGDLIKNPEVLKLYEERLAIYNEKFARVEQIKKFRLLKNSFSQETGEITPTMKLKRKVIHEKYKDLIDDMYK